MMAGHGENVFPMGTQEESQSFSDGDPIDDQEDESSLLESEEYLGSQHGMESELSPSPSPVRGRGYPKRRYQWQTGIASQGLYNRATSSLTQHTLSDLDLQNEEQQQPVTPCAREQSTHMPALLKEEGNIMRKMLIYSNPVVLALQAVFEFGTKGKDPLETLKEYLLRTKRISQKHYKRLFQTHQRLKIDKDPSCKSFDILLLYHAIQYGCDDLASPDDANVWYNSPDSLENCLMTIKTLRNEAVFGSFPISDEEFADQVEVIRSILFKTLKLAQTKYSVDDSVITTVLEDIGKMISRVKDMPLDELALRSGEGPLVLKPLPETLKKDVIRDLKKILQVLALTNLAPLMPHHNIQITIDFMYTTVQYIPMVFNNQTGLEELEKFNARDFLLYADSRRQEEMIDKVHLIVLEGVAGIGKTIFLKAIMADWIHGKQTGNYAIKGLEVYECIIPIECYDNSHSSLESLISFLMPTVKKSFRDGKQMMEFLLASPMLILVDGIDVLNSNSERIFKQILELQKHSKITIVCTRRPMVYEERVKYFENFPSETLISAYRFNIIPQDLKEEFIGKYHNYLRKSEISLQDTEGLVTYLRTTASIIQDHWGIPVNLTELSLLWAVDSKQVDDITNGSELFDKINRFNVQRFNEKVLSATKLNQEEKKQKEKMLQKLVSAFYREALIGFRDDTLYLSEAAHQRLEDACTSKDVPSSLFFETFFLQYNIWCPQQTYPPLIFPSRSWQEFYGVMNMFLIGMNMEKLWMAQAICNFLLEHKYPPSTIAETSEKAYGRRTTLVEFFEELHEDLKEKPSLSKYTNALIMLLDVFCRGKKWADEMDTIQISKILKEDNVYSDEDWLEILSKIKVTDSTGRMLSRLPGLFDENILVVDKNVYAYYSLFDSYRPDDIHLFKGKIPKRISIEITGNPFILPQLCHLLHKTSEMKLMTALKIDTFFKDPLEKTTPVSEKIYEVINKCKLGLYCGEVMPDLMFNEETTKALEELWVSTPNAASYKRFLDVLDGLKILDNIKVNLPLSMANEDLQPLPGVWRVDLYIANVGKNDIPTAMKIVKKMFPVNGKYPHFRHLMFPRSTLEEGEIEHFLNQIPKEVKCSRSIRFPTKCCPSSLDERDRLDEIAKKILECEEGLIWGRVGHWEDSTEDMDRW